MASVAASRHAEGIAVYMPGVMGELQEEQPLSSRNVLQQKTVN